ncbi:MAG: TonB-dependent receptor [Candidatus Binatia bacterium]
MTGVGRSIGVGIAFSAGLSLFGPADGWAQAAKKKASATETEIEEITVTAQRREESLQETPISVTAFTGAALQQKGVQNVVDLGQTVPNVRIVSNVGSPASTTVTVRGLVQGNPHGALQSKVGMYLDGVYLAKTYGNNLDLEDLERVEVLRGPQGTLYGRNTIGGAINFLTNKPTEQRSVTVKTEVGNYDTFNGRVTFNVPVIGKNGFLQSEAIGTLSLRETAGYKSHDGFYDNALPPNAPAGAQTSGAGSLDNLNRVYTTTALRWQPRQGVTVDYSFEFHRYRDHPTAFQLTYIYPNSTISRPRLGPNPNPFYAIPYVQKNRSDSTANNALLGSDLKSLHQLRDDGNHRLHILNGAWDVGALGPLGNITIKSISSYRNFEYQADQDGDGTPNQVANLVQYDDTEHWSQELQWLGTAPRFHYVLGAYYFGEYTMQRNQPVFFAGANAVPYRDFLKTKSYAPYGQATWTPPIFSDKLSLTAGIRYTQEQVHGDHYFGKAVSPTSTAAGFVIHGGKAFGGTDAISPMFDVAYQWTDEVMTYFRISRGFTGGGFNPGAPLPVLFTTFDPETLWAFESGFKSEWLNKRVRINADGFFSYYNDLQVSVFHASPNLGSFSVVGNADRAEIWGMEFEAAAIPVRGLEATVNYSFLSPTYTKWRDQKFDANNQPIFDPSGDPVLEDVADKRAFPFSPRNQATVALTYTAPPTASGIFSAHIETYWQDKVDFITNNQTPGAQAMVGWAYALVNGRLAYTGIPLQKGNLDLALYARNLFDRKYRSFGIDFGAGLGYAGNVYGNPRTFGLQLTYNFAES